jgi:hypothetical protein
MVLLHGSPFDLALAVAVGHLPALLEEGHVVDGHFDA